MCTLAYRMAMDLQLVCDELDDDGFSPSATVGIMMVLAGCIPAYIYDEASPSPRKFKAFYDRVLSGASDFRLLFPKRERAVARMGSDRPSETLMSQGESSAATAEARSFVVPLPVFYDKYKASPVAVEVVRRWMLENTTNASAGVVAAFAMLMGEASESVSIIVSNKEALKLSASVNIPLTMVERANAALKGLRLAQSVSVIDVSVIDVTAG